ncbi:MAG TPA: GNAT family N-acetyltransferase [Solirubrobacterales bacterium]|jgi:phosphinothricin acetyltransferase
MSRPETPELTIRDADPVRDAAACAAIYAPAVEDGAISFELRAPAPEEIAERMRRYQRTHPWLVAERGGKVVGYAYACSFNERPAYRWSTAVSVYVAAAERGRGRGRALYEELFARLRRQGLRMACAGITLPNPASVGLHEALGFRPVGVYGEIGWKQGAWQDVGWWQLELCPPAAGPPAEPLPPG